MEAHSAPAPGAPELEPIQPGSGRNERSLLKRIGGTIAAIGAAIANFAAKAKFLLLAVTKVKLLATSASMLVSIVAYQFIFGWEFSVGLVILLLVHEMGHVIQLRREGIKASAPMFIPFLGAVVAMKAMPEDAAAEARVGLAGPVLGSLGALVPLVIWLAGGSELWRALAYLGFFLNLFNLLPVLPLDGGRAMAAMSPWVWIAGIVALVPLAFFFPSPIILIIVVLGGLETVRRFKARKTDEGRAYYSIPTRQRSLIAIVYLGLIAALAFGVAETHFARTLSDIHGS